MSPKHILWIAFSIVSTTWYTLDPAAHPVNDLFAKAPSVEVRQIVDAPAPEGGMRMAML